MKTLSTLLMFQLVVLSSSMLAMKSQQSARRSQQSAEMSQQLLQGTSILKNNNTKVEAGVPVVRDRYLEDEMAIEATRESCTDHLSPCSCSEILSSEMRHHKSGMVISVEYAEFSCNQKLNKRRKMEGGIPNGFMCVQMMARRNMYR